MCAVHYRGTYDRSNPSVFTPILITVFTPILITDPVPNSQHTINLNLGQDTRANRNTHETDKHSQSAAPKA